MLNLSTVKARLFLPSWRAISQPVGSGGNTHDRQQGTPKQGTATVTIIPVEGEGTRRRRGLTTSPPPEKLKFDKGACELLDHSSHSPYTPNKVPGGLPGNQSIASSLPGFRTSTNHLLQLSSNLYVCRLGVRILRFKILLLHVCLQCKNCGCAGGCAWDCPKILDCGSACAISGCYLAPPSPASRRRVASATAASTLPRRDAAPRGGGKRRM